MTNIRYRVFALNFVACLINYADRITLSVAAPFILEEYDFSPTVWGVILSAFFWTYSPFALVGGFMADRIGVRRAYTVCMLVWSLTLPVTASAWNAASFIVARMLFGMGEGPQAPISAKLTAQWFPRRQTSTMLNMAQSGTTIGPIIATPFIVWMCNHIGWRPAFVVLSSFGIVWCVFWWFIARDRPEDHPKVDAAERDFITADHADPPTADAADSTTDTAEGASKSGAARRPGTEQGSGSGGASPGFWDLVLRRPVIALATAFFAYSWVLFMFLTWYPKYLVDARGVDESDLGGIATLPWIAATAGLISGGLVADWLIRRFGSLVAPRKWMIVGSLTMVAVCFGPSPFVASPTVGLVLVCVATFFLFASYHYQALIIATVPQHYTGRLAGTIQMCSTLAGALAPTVTGAVVGSTGSYNSAFLLGGVLAAAGAVVVAFLVRGNGTDTQTGGRREPQPYSDIPTPVSRP